MLNAIERNAFNPTRKLKGQKQAFVNPELEKMKCGGKVHKMELGGEYKFEPTIGQTYDDFTVQGGWSDQRGLGFAPDKRVWDGEKWVGQQHRSTDPVSKEEQAIADKLRQEFLNSDAGMELRERVAQNNARFLKSNPIVEALAKKEFAKQNPESVGYEMQDGGEYFKTKLSAKDEKKFQKFFKTLPDNLQVDDDLYDIRGYWDAEGRPDEFDYSQPKESDGYYHAYTRHPRTGKILKSPAHPTFAPAMDYETAKRVDVYGNVYTGLPEMPIGGETNPLANLDTTPVSLQGAEGFNNPQSVNGPIEEDVANFIDANQNRQAKLNYPTIDGLPPMPIQKVDGLYNPANPPTPKGVSKGICTNCLKIDKDYEEAYNEVIRRRNESPTSMTIKQYTPGKRTLAQKVFRPKRGVKGTWSDQEYDTSKMTLEEIEQMKNTANIVDINHNQEPISDAEIRAVMEELKKQKTDVPKRPDQQLIYKSDVDNYLSQYPMQYGGLTKMPHGGTHDKLKKIVNTVTFNTPAKDDSKSLDEVVVAATKPKRKHSNYSKQVLPEGYDEQDLYNDKMLFYNNWKRDYDEWNAIETQQDFIDYRNRNDKEDTWWANQEALDRITLFDPDDNYSLIYQRDKPLAQKVIDGNIHEFVLWEEPVNPKQPTSSAEESDYPTGWKPIMYQGKALDPNVYGYMESTTTNVPLESITSNPVLWMNKRKGDMQTWNKSGEFPWGYRFNYGGDIPKMPGGGFLGDYTPAMGQPTKRKAFDYGFTPSYNTTLGTTGQLDFRKGWRGRGDQKATHNILGNIYGGRNQFGTTAGGSVGYGMQYNWNPSMNTIFRGDVGYDRQLGLNTGLEAGHRWNIVPSKQTKSGAKHSGSFDALVGFGVHSKPD
jgi:hypothetical protein